MSTYSGSPHRQTNGNEARQVDSSAVGGMEVEQESSTAVPEHKTTAAAPNYSSLSGDFPAPAFRYHQTEMFPEHHHSQHDHTQHDHAVGSIASGGTTSVGVTDGDIMGMGIAGVDFVDDIAELAKAVKKVLPVVCDGKVHTSEDLYQVGKLVYLREDYNACLAVGKILLPQTVAGDDSSLPSTQQHMYIPEIALLGGEHFVRALLTNATAGGILTSTATGYKTTPKGKTAIANCDDEYYGDDESSQLFGDVTSYGGMTEWEGWAYAPLKTRDLVHVRLVHPVSLDSLRKKFPVWDVSESPEGTVVVTGKPGDPVKAAIVEWLEQESIPYESVRSAKEVSRRDLRELPPAFLHDVLVKTTPLAYSTVARKHRASMEVLTGSLDDTRAWVGLWVTEFATMFDAAKGRPFAAWVQVQIRHKVQDLNRAINGRTASDLEIKWARAHEYLETNLGRSPTVEEISHELNLSYAEGQTKRSLIGQLKAIRSATPLDTGPDVADLPIVDHLADPEQEALNREMRQRVTLAILAAAGTYNQDTGERTLELPLGFISTYLLDWGDWVKSDLVYLSGCASSNITKELSLLRESLKYQLADLYQEVATS